MAESCVVSSATARESSQGWVDRHVKEGTSFVQTPWFLGRNRACKYAQAFARVAKGNSFEILKVTRRAPLANAVCERAWEVYEEIAAITD